MAGAAQGEIEQESVITLGGGSGGRRLLAGLAALLTGEGLARLLVIAVGLTVARTLGPTSFGQLSFALSILALCAVVTDAGFTTYALREAVARPERRSSLVVNATAVQLGVALLAAGILVVVGLLAPLPVGSGRVVVALAPLLLAQAANTLYALQSVERFRAVAAVKVSREAVTTALAITLVLTTRQIVLVPVAMWTGFLVGDAICARLLVTAGDLRRASLDRSVLRDLLHGGWPFLTNALLAQVVIGVDVIFLGALRGPRAAGVYAAAFQLAYYALLVAGIVTTSVFPQLTSRWSQDREAFARLVRRLLSLSMRISLPCATAAIVCAPWIMRIVFGKRFDDGAVVLSILVGLPVLGYYNTITGQALMAAGRARLHLLVIAMAAAGALISLAVLVPFYGPAGAAVATVVVEALSAVWLSILLPRYLGVDTVPVVARELPGALLLCAALVGMRLLRVEPGIIIVAAVVATAAREAPWIARTIRASAV